MKRFPYKVGMRAIKNKSIYKIVNVAQTNKGRYVLILQVGAWSDWIPEKEFYKDYAIVTHLEVEKEETDQ